MPVFMKMDGIDSVGPQGVRDGTSNTLMVGEIIPLEDDPYVLTRVEHAATENSGSGDGGIAWVSGQGGVRGASASDVVISKSMDAGSPIFFDEEQPADSLDSLFGGEAAGSPHSGGMLASLCDGSVRNLDASFDPAFAAGGFDLA